MFVKPYVMSIASAIESRNTLSAVAAPLSTLGYLGLRGFFTSVTAIAAFSAAVNALPIKPAPT